MIQWDAAAAAALVVGERSENAEEFRALVGS
jgi:hypothetical protein